MTTLRKLTDTLSVSPQIAAADLPALHAAGIRAIICNRPDGEGADQPTVTEIRAAAAPLGIDVHYLPVDTGKVTDDQAAQFGALVASLDGPVLAYCRSGTLDVTEDFGTWVGRPAPPAGAIPPLQPFVRDDDLGVPCP